MISQIQYEKPFWDTKTYVAGVDEVGRGCLAGPVVAAAVVLPLNYTNMAGIHDSKQVSEKKRNELYGLLQEEALSISIQSLAQDVIDRINIRNATLQCMQRALDSLSIPIHHAFIDGNYFVHESLQFTTIVKGDATCLSIAAASIAAKVFRDDWMKTIAHEQYPEYRFDKNKGYGTQQHLESLAKYGPCELHRQTFLRKFFERQLTLFINE
jgi:ribonuclease HII